ncbi:MAG TPA: non-homologous end-joining DNA ligase [Actinomycetota bacterium]|nr:non-homologous end-joining DNA ligase [Actinomycetota bacterium]
MAHGDTYSDKRSFDRTPEPAGTPRADVDPGVAPPGRRFVIHQHHARRLHFDLRLEMMNGDLPVLASWAIPKNLPAERGTPHLAVHVEDHPIDYGSFSGTIPAGNYGAGEVRIFDSGSYEVLEQEPGKLSFRLHGRRLKGVWHLARTRSGDGRNEEWLAFLKQDEREPFEPVPELKPMLATAHPEAFDSDDFLFEPKWDGVRALAVCTEETVLVSRTERNITEAYPELSQLHERLVSTGAVLDGEIVALEGGRPSFERLQSRINLRNARDVERAARAAPVTYIAFDLIYLDGRSLTERPLEERKTLLEEVVVASERVRVSSPCIESEGTALLQAVEQWGLEGIVAKRKGCPYRPGRRTRDWLKIKVVHEADVVVGGWSPGEGARASSFGALLVGAYDGDGLRFVGAVGTGFSQAMLDDLLPRLQEHRVQECPFSDDLAQLRLGRFGGRGLRDARWVRPELVARVEFRELTSAPRLRAPSFKGLRDDKEARDCRLSDLLAEAGRA